MSTIIDELKKFDASICPTCYKKGKLDTIKKADFPDEDETDKEYYTCDSCKHEWVAHFETISVCTLIEVTEVAEVKFKTTGIFSCSKCGSDRIRMCAQTGGRNPLYSYCCKDCKYQWEK